jgi:hypothetical protein
MVTLTAAADSWKSWLDDAPLPETFNSATGGLQDFITALSRALLTARAELDTTQTQLGDWIVRADEANVKVETLDAELARVRADAELAVAEALREAAEACQYLHVAKTKNRHGPWNSAVLQCCELLRALAPADGLAAVKALRVEARENAMQALASMGQAQEAYEAQLKAEAELAAAQQRERVLREALKRLLPAARHYGGLTDDHAKSIEHAEATIRDSQIVATDPGDGWTWNERLGWIGPDGKPADPRRRG